MCTQDEPCTVATVTLLIDLRNLHATLVGLSKPVDQEFNRNELLIAAQDKITSIIEALPPDNGSNGWDRTAALIGYMLIEYKKLNDIIITNTVKHQSYTKN